MRKLLRDPLVHFLLAGGVIWGALALLGDPEGTDDRSITLSREQQAGLALAFERTMGRVPTDAELDARIAQWVREEVLYREALRLGLDEGDPVVKRRLATKMDEIASAQAELAQPSEKDLRAWFAGHAGDYESTGAADFEQAYFPSQEEARAALGPSRPRGKPISLPPVTVMAAPADIERTFGTQFAQGLSQLEVAPEWQGPLQSGYGWHLVLLSRREDGRVPEFAEVRDRVERDWRSRTIAARREEAYRVLRDAYAVEVE